MLSLKYYWELCGQRKHPSVCSLKEMKVEARVRTYRDYQERTQVVWQDCLPGSPCAHLFSRKRWLYFCHSAIRPVTTWVLADWQSCKLITATLISNWYVTMRRELQRCKTSGLVIKKSPHKMIYCCLNFLTTGTEIPYLLKKLPPKSWVNLRWTISLTHHRNVSFF